MIRLRIIFPIALAAVLTLGSYPKIACAIDDYMKEDLEELKERMDQVEKKTLTDKLSIGAEVRARYDAFTFKDNDANIDDKVNGIGSTRIRLNLSAEANSRMKFHARMGIHNNWNDRDNVETISEVAAASRLRGDTSLKVERAYADYFFESIPLVFTIGRVPATDGLPTNFREDTPRKSTYPSMSYEVEADGVGISVLLDKMTGLPDAALRILISEVTFDDDDEIFRNDTVEVNNEEIYLTQLETGFPWNAFSGVMVIANWMHMPEISPQTTDMISPLFPAQVVVDFSSYPGFSALPSGGLYVCDTSDLELVSKNIGRLDKYTLFIQSERFMKTWFDWFVGYSMIKTKGIDEPLYRFSVDTSAAESDAVTYLGYPAGEIGDTQVQETNMVGLLTDEIDKNRSGHCFYAGTRMNLPVEILKKPKIGIEYNRSSKYWVGFYYAPEDPLAKLDIRGNVWDFYYIQPVDNGFSFRIGFTRAEVDYDSSTLYYSEPRSVDKEITNTYILADMKF